MPNRLSAFLSPRRRHSGASSPAPDEAATDASHDQRKADGVQQRSESTAYSCKAHWSRDWINFTLLRSLLKECDNSPAHAGCRTARRKSRIPPRWLVDVENESLIPGRSDTQYIALSYVWGRIECSNTNQGNLDDLQRPGALAKAQDGIYLPQTIRDAMEICKKLQIRYMWIDMLCIVQDDEESKHSEIQNMGDIYEGAYVTVVAAGGKNADSGIWGIPMAEGGRKRTQDPEHGILQYRQGSHADAIRSALWYKRGCELNSECKNRITTDCIPNEGTFQEFALSIRTIKFLKDHFLWGCPQLFWSESTNADFRTQSFIVKPPDLRWKRMGIPNWNSLYGAASDYNHRYFTYPDDVVDAFRGVASYLAPLFGQFVYGISLAHIDSALLWMPENNWRSEMRTDTERVPSWSWMSFRSPIVSFIHHDSQHAHDHEGAAWFLKYGDQLISVREFASGHDIPKSLGNSMLESGRLLDPIPQLFGKVECAKVSITQAGSLETVVLNREGKACGMVSTPSLCDWENAKFELIKVSSYTGSYAIQGSKAYRYEHLVNRLAMDEFDAAKNEKCVNVLMIEREGDAAFRKGIGYVLEKAWQTLNREWVDIILK